MRTRVLTTAVVFLLAAFSPNANALSKEEYRSGKDTIAAQYNAAEHSRASASGNAKDMCMANAKGNEKVSMAELEASHTGKEKDKRDCMFAKAYATCDVAKQKCDDRTGNDKDAGMKEAKASLTNAAAAVKLGKTVQNAALGPADERAKPNYKVAIEKCDSLAGDAEAASVSAAKTHFKQG